MPDMTTPPPFEDGRKERAIVITEIATGYLVTVRRGPGMYVSAQYAARDGAEVIEICARLFGVDHNVKATEL